MVARDIAHAKLQERIDAGKGLPDYVKDHIIYYAGGDVCCLIFLPFCLGGLWLWLLVWFGLVWFGSVWFDLVRFGLVWFELVTCG